MISASGKKNFVHKFLLRFMICNWNITFQNVANTNNTLFSFYVTFFFLKKKTQKFFPPSSYHHWKQYIQLDLYQQTARI